MKKILSFVIVVLFGTISFSSAQETCDQTFYGTLRYYKGYIFNDTFNNPGAGSLYLRNYRVDYVEQYDYNTSVDFPIFGWTDEIKTKDYEVKGGESIKFLEAKTPYYIYSVPATRQKDNLFLKYTTTYSTDVGGINKKNHTECKYYEISRCGDGVKDPSYDEECDKIDSTPQGYTCSPACKLVQTPIPNCTLTLDKTSILSGGSATISRNIVGSGDFPTSIVSNPVISSFPHSVSTSVGSKTVTVNQAGNYTFNMTVKSINGQNSCNANLVVTPPVEKKVDLSLTKTVNKSFTKSDENIIFSISVKNSGPDGATNVQVTDSIPSGYEYISNTVSQGSYNFANGIRTIGDIDINETKTISITVKVKKTGEHLNIAEVTKCDQKDIDSTPNNHISTEDDQDSETIVVTQEECDQTFYGTLRYYKGYIFNDTFNNPGAGSLYLRNYRVDYVEQYDYNNSADFPMFGWTDTIKLKDYEVKGGESIKFLEAKTPYYIYSVPATRQKDNLFLKYTTTYSADVGGINKIEQTACKYYEISRCGDGVKDPSQDPSYNEECDKTDSTPQGYTCSTTCKLIQTPIPTCTLTLDKTSILSGGSTTISRNIVGSGDFPTSIVSNPILSSFPHSVSTSIGSKTFNINKVGTYDFNMIVKNISGQNSCNAILISSEEEIPPFPLPTEVDLQ